MIFSRVQKIPWHPEARRAHHPDESKFNSCSSSRTLAEGSTSLTGGAATSLGCGGTTGAPLIDKRDKRGHDTDALLNDQDVLLYGLVDRCQFPAHNASPSAIKRQLACKVHLQFLFMRISDKKASISSTR